METEVEEPKKVAQLEEAPPRPKQMKAFDTFEELPEDVQECAETLDKATEQWQLWGERMKEARKEMRALMKEYNLRNVPCPGDDDKVFALVTSEPEEKVKKVPRSKAPGADDDE